MYTYAMKPEHKKIVMWLIIMAGIMLLVVTAVYVYTTSSKTEKPRINERKTEKKEDRGWLSKNDVDGAVDNVNELVRLANTLKMLLISIGKGLREYMGWDGKSGSCNCIRPGESVEHPN